MWVSRLTPTAPALRRAFVLGESILPVEAYTSSMSQKWVDPAKQPPKKETMNTPGDFKVFTDLMRKIVQKPKTASHGPARS